MLLLLITGCAAPVAEAPSATAAATSSARASASEAPTSAEPTPTASSAPTLAFEPPDGILPPNSIVRVVVDTLQLRTEPGLGAPVEGTALKGDQFSVAGWSGPVRRDGLDWYRLGPATVGDLDAWAAAGSGADSYLEVVRPECPVVDPDLSMLISMGSWDRLACFDDRSLTLEGTFGCGVCDGVYPGEFTPAWLAHPIAGNFLWAEFQAEAGPLVIHVPPDSGVEIPTFGSIVRAFGHFSDPVSTSCSISTFDGEGPITVDPRTAELYCRERFVIDALEVIGTDPSYSDPYNP